MIYKPEGVCTKMMNIEVDNDVIKSVDFIGGCAGNAQGIAKLIKGMKVNDVIEKLDGIKCGFRDTSCPDQLAKALKEYQKSNK